MLIKPNLIKNKMATTQVRKDKEVEQALEGLESFTLSPKFTTRDGYCVRLHEQPPQTEPLPEDQNLEQAQIYRFITGPGNAIYGDVQPDGTITLNVRSNPSSPIAEVAIAAAVRGYGVLQTYLIKGGLEFNPDKDLERGVSSCSNDLGI